MYPFQEEVSELMQARVGVTAEMVSDALASLHETQSSALTACYRSPGGGSSDEGDFTASEISAAAHLGIDAEMYRRRLRAAHADFMLAYSLERRRLFAAVA